jgi:glucose-1-phosphate thymidylyltransferase
MQLIVLAGGFSTRLYPLTKTRPKGLLPVSGRPIADYLFSQAKSLPNLKSMVWVTNSLYYKQFRDWLGNRAVLIDNGASTPEDRLGAIGDLHLALKQVSFAEDTLVLPSDTMAGIDIANFWQSFMAINKPLNAIYDIGRKDLIAGKLGCVETDGRVITGFEEKPAKPKSTLVSVPIYAFPKVMLPLIGEYIALKKPLDAPGSLLQWLISKMQVSAYMLDSYYYDIGTVEAYNEVRLRFEKKLS